MIDSKTVYLGGRMYLVYLKEVNVRINKDGNNKTTIRAFVKEIDG
jgi:hypothetical protein